MTRVARWRLHCPVYRDLAHGIDGYGVRLWMQSSQLQRKANCAFWSSCRLGMVVAIGVLFEAEIENLL